MYVMTSCDKIRFSSHRLNDFRKTIRDYLTEIIMQEGKQASNSGEDASFGHCIVLLYINSVFPVIKDLGAKDLFST